MSSREPSVLPPSLNRLAPRSLPAKEASKALLERITAVMDDAKAVDLVVIDLAGKTDIADYMVIATGTSSRHAVSVAERVAEDLKKDVLGYMPPMEGAPAGDWVVVDAQDVIVHVFRREVREYYKLERMWGGPAENEGPRPE